MLATKERIVAPRSALERYIRSTHPVLYISGRRDFQGTNNFLSDDAYGRICTVSGALWTREGYSFDGTDDYIERTSFPLNWTSSDWTLLIWAKNDAPDASDMRGLAGVRFGAGAADWWTFGQYGDANRYMYFEYTAGATFSSTFKSLGTGWHFYAIVHSGTTITATRDNGLALLSGDLGATNIGGTTNDFRLGQWFTSSQNWSGLATLCCIYDRALSAVERANYYRQERHFVS